MVTYDRPDYYLQAKRALIEYLDHLVDEWAFASEEFPVAKAKNLCMQRLLDRGCDWLFISEDDVVVQSEMAVTGYIDACTSSGLEHLSFAHHGPANAGKQAVVRSDGVTLWPEYVGAWCVYSRRSLLDCGLLDENFVNAFEHVEHTLRLGLKGYTTFGRSAAADATRSQSWIHEIPGSIENSSIRKMPDWAQNIRDAESYWIAKAPETARIIWPEKVPA